MNSIRSAGFLPGYMHSSLFPIKIKRMSLKFIYFLNAVIGDLESGVILSGIKEIEKQLQNFQPDFPLQTHLFITLFSATTNFRVQYSLSLTNIIHHPVYTGCMVCSSMIFTRFDIIIKFSVLLKLTCYSSWSFIQVSITHFYHRLSRRGNVLLAMV